MSLRHLSIVRPDGTRIPIVDPDQDDYQLTDDAYAALREAIDRIPDPPPLTRRRRLAFWLGDVWWRLTKPTL